MEVSENLEKRISNRIETLKLVIAYLQELPEYDITFSMRLHEELESLLTAEMHLKHKKPITTEDFYSICDAFTLSKKEQKKAFTSLCKTTEPDTEPITTEIKPVFYKPEEVADILKVNYLTVLRRIRSGKLKAVKLGKGYRIEAKELERMLHDNH